VAALGAVTGNRPSSRSAQGLDAIYWQRVQVAADANTHGSTYPDQSLYPWTAFPARPQDQTRRLQRAESDSSTPRAARVATGTPDHRDARRLRRALNAFELMKGMIEAGAAGVHFEDQLSSEKKCGHLGARSGADESVHPHAGRARLAADVRRRPDASVARTDANSAKLLTFGHDPYDRPFLSATGRPRGSFRITGGLDCAIARGLAYAPYADLLWCETSKPDLPRPAGSPSRSTPASRASSCLQLLPFVHLAKAPRRNAISPASSASWVPWGTGSSSSPSPDSTRSITDVRAGREYRNRGMSAYSDLQQAEFAAEAQGYSPPGTSARSARPTSTTSPR